MTITLNGTTGITDVNGTAAAPAITGTDTDSGMYFGTNIVALATGGTAAVTVDSSQNVGIGTTSPSSKLDVRGNASFSGNATSRQTANFTNTGGDFYVGAESSAGGAVFGGSSAYAGIVGTNNATSLQFASNAVVRATIDSSGNFIVGRTSAYGSEAYCGYRAADAVFQFDRGNDGTIGTFRRGGTVVGSISVTASATAYNTSSDYRLKNTIAPMTGALAKVALLKPCTYKWNIDGSDGQGFIAHELDEVVQGCVTGEKDAVDSDGNPVHQGIDTSFLVATLTAAIQELNAKFEEYKAAHP